MFNLRFSGQYYDQETGLFYNVFRDYDPQTGRYSESDPIGLQGGINIYTYVENNPINYVDPDGKSPIAVAIRIASTAYTAYKIFDYYESMSNLDNEVENYQKAQEIQDQAYEAILNGTKIPNNFNQNASNDAIQNIAKAGANAAMKGAKLPGTSASGPVTTKCPPVK